MLSRIVRAVLIMWALLILVPSALHAQAIAGVVKDTSGAVLPGVTVVASSPALIEKSRTATTDGSGNYLITNLRVGVYTLTFTLAGFNTSRREGIDLPADFTASINAELKVGASETTISVTSEAPVMDVKESAVEEVLEEKTLTEVPLGGRDIQGMGVATAGVQQSGPDVGGSGGMQQTYMTAHGADPRDNTIMEDGVRLNGIEGDGGIQQYFNTGAFSEVGYQTSAIGAEHSGGGLAVNMIPKDGSNQFHGNVFYSQTTASLEAAPVLATANKIIGMHDVNADIGGPILKDKLWFIFIYRHWGVNQTVANSFDPAVAASNSSVQNLNSPTVDSNLIRSYFPRFTWQVSKNNKFSVQYDKIVKYRGGEQSSEPSSLGSTSQWTTDAFSTRVPFNYYLTVWKWQTILTSRLILDVGFGINNESYTTGELQPNLESCLAAHTCSPIPSFNNGVSYGAPSGPFFTHKPVRNTGNASISYVTGSHALKAGFEDSWGYNSQVENFQNPNVNFDQGFGSVSVGGVSTPNMPTALYFYNTPFSVLDQLHADLGIYVQDKWTIKHRLTVSPGIRWEYFHTGYVHESVPLASRNLLQEEGFNLTNSSAPLYLPSDFPAKGMPIWRSWSPRIGVAYDVFGNGKTAIKGGFNDYQQAFSTITVPGTYNPMAIANSQQTWCPPPGVIAGTACTYPAGTTAATFLTSGPGGRSTIPFNPATDAAYVVPQTAPFGSLFRSLDPKSKRPYMLEYNVQVQQQVHPGISVSFAYYRRTWENLLASYNTALQSSISGPLTVQSGPSAGQQDWTLQTLPNPCGANGPSAGLCGGVSPANMTLYAINPALVAGGSSSLYKLGQIVDTNATTNMRVYNGFEETFAGKIGKGTFFGGITTQRQVSNLCQSSTLTSGGATSSVVAGSGFSAASDPNYAGQFCDQTKYSIPFRTMFKVSGTYALPVGFNVGGTFQSYPGTYGSGAAATNAPWQYMTYTLPASITNPAPGNPGLTPGQATESFTQLIQPGTLYLPRLNEMDLRVSRTFNFEKWGKLEAQMDIFNALNGHAIITQSTGYSTTVSKLNAPTSYLLSRLVQFGLQYHF